MEVEAGTFENVAMELLSLVCLTILWGWHLSNCHLVVLTCNHAASALQSVNSNLVGVASQNEGQLARIFLESYIQHLSVTEYQLGLMIDALIGTQ